MINERRMVKLALLRKAKLIAKKILKQVQQDNKKKKGGGFYNTL